MVVMMVCMCCRSAGFEAGLMYVGACMQITPNHALLISASLINAISNKVNRISACLSYLNVLPTT
jgi:hypothetical protein